jgi:CheY-like chemotaxis protein
MVPTQEKTLVNRDCFRTIACDATADGDSRVSVELHHEKNCGMLGNHGQPKGGTALTAKKVLHVDDDELTLRTVARHLKASGFTVFSTTSPFIAPIIQAERPDVIVMDIDMPLLSGDRIVSIIRGNDFSTLPVIYFSGKPDHILAALAAKTQPATFMSKDKGLPALVQKIMESTTGGC